MGEKVSCSTCKYFSEFKEPRRFEKYAIFGRCFKPSKVFPRQSLDGYNVYLPSDTSAACKSYKRDTSKPKET